MRKYIDYTVSVDTGLAEDDSLIHVPAEKRGEAGQALACSIVDIIYNAAGVTEGNTPVCPGCAMSVTLNGLRELAKCYGWDFAYIRDHLVPALNEIADEGITHADKEALNNA